MGEDIFSSGYLLAIPVYALVLLAVLVLHEMGHYMAARIFGMPIRNVVIGRGKLIKTWRSARSTEWRLHLFPVGAHVHIDNIDVRPFYQKIITILAGPIINFVVILPLFFLFYLTVGQPSIPNMVVGVEQGLASDRAGIEVGDQFIAMNGVPLSNHDDIWRIAYKRGTVESTYTIRRGEETFDVNIKPGWAEYKDQSGIHRENARFGVVWDHGAFALDSIVAVNGVSVKDQDQARALILENFDREVLIGIKGPEDKVRSILFHPRSENNQGLLDQDDDYYESVFLGETMGSVYMSVGVFEGFVKSARYSANLFTSIAKVPFQIFPIDKSQIHNQAAVINPDTKIENAIYKIIHLFAVASVAIGLINLLPFPNLDGGQLIDQTLRRVWGDGLTPKHRSMIYAGVFLLLYASVFIANMDNLHGYIDSRLKKVHELYRGNDK